MPELGNHEPATGDLADTTVAATSVPSGLIEVAEPGSDSGLVRLHHRVAYPCDIAERPQQRHALGRRERHIERCDRFGDRPVGPGFGDHFAAQHLLG